MLLLKIIIRKVISIIKSARIKFDSLYFYKIEFNNIDIADVKYSVIKAINIDDLKAIYEERKANFKKVYQKWLSLGYICFIVKVENKTVGLLWLNNTPIVPLEFNYQLELKNKDEAGIIDGYVLKDYRGKGVYKEIWNSVLVEARNMDITILYAQILKNNIASIKIHYPLGMKHVYQILYYYRILWFNIYKLKKFNTPIDVSELRKDIKFN